MLLIGLTHMIQHERLDGTLISTDLENLGLNTKFLKSSLKEEITGGQPDELDCPLGIKDHLIGYRREVVGLLSIAICIGIDKLT